MTEAGHPKPTLRQLEYLVAVADTLNFREAADRCFVTQPALSKQLQQLEATLGVQLFERDPRRVLPTAAGREIARQARDVLRQVDRLVETAQGMTGALRGALRVGVIPTIAPYLVPRVVPAVRRAFPELNLMLREERTPELVQGLNEGRLDLLLLDIDVELGGADAELLFTDEFVFAAPASHPLATKDVLSVADLKSAEILLLEEGHCLRNHVLPLCTRAGSVEAVDFRASSLVTLVEMVKSGIGVTLLPEMAVQAFESDPALAIRPFDDPPMRQIGLAWRSGSARAGEFRRLGDVMREAYAAAD
ncbi:MAG: LysR family transcriptional regulator [Candidatus Competibacteraceae bacterium]|nr:LysR family transcriptional regulator [Candidatus Competibacteraceae bacterium]